MTVNYKGSGVVAGYAPGITPPPDLDITLLDNSTPGIATFQVTVAATGQAPGNYSSSLRFASGDLPPGATLDDATNVVTADLPVTETVQNFYVAPSGLDLTSVDGSTALESGSVTLSIDNRKHWTATSNQPWLTVTPSGTGPGNIAYSVDSGALSLSVQGAAIVRVTDDSGNTAIVPVQVQVNPPQLVANPASLVLTVDANTSPAAATQAVTITDDLGGTVPSKILSWSVGPDAASVVDVSPSSGTSAPGDKVQVSVDLAALPYLANASYSSSFQLSYTSEDGFARTLTVPVTFNLNSPTASISVTPAQPTTVGGYGLSVSFTATGTNVDGYSQDLTDQVVWNSSNTAVATLGKPTASVAQAVAPGTAIISANLPGANVTGSATLTVEAPVGYAYALTSSPGVAQFVYGSNGIPISLGLPNAGASIGTQMLLSRNARFLYVSNLNDGTISQYGIGTNGVLTPLSNPTVAGAGFSLTEDSTGSYLYATNQSQVFQYSVGADGSLTPLSPAALSVGNDSFQIAASSALPYVYIAQDSTISQFSVSGSGALTPLIPISVASGTYPQNLVSDPGGQHLYALIDPLSDQSPQLSGTIQQFSITPNCLPSPPSQCTKGALTLHSSSSSGVAPRRMVFTPAGTYAYVLNVGVSSPDGSASASASIGEYQVGADGGLTSLLALPVMGFIPLSGPISTVLAVDPDGKYIYATSDLTFKQFLIGTNGTLGLINTNPDALLSTASSVVFVKKN